MSLEVKCIPLIIPMINAINITIYTKRVVAIIVVRGDTVRNILLDSNFIEIFWNVSLLTLKVCISYFR